MSSRSGSSRKTKLNSGNQIGFTENLSFRDRTANNMQSVNQKNILKLCDKNSTRVKVSGISETLLKRHLHILPLCIICIIIITTGL